MPLSKDEYLKASRGLATGFGSTVDFADPQIGGTVQNDDGIADAYESLPGQVFSVDQLPNPAVAIAYGLPPQTIPEHLIMDSTEDAEKHIQGKDGLDIVTAQLRRDLGDPVLTFDNQIASEDDSLKMLDERTGENAFGLSNDDGRNDGNRNDGDGDGDSDVDHGKPVDPAGVQKAGGAEETRKRGDRGAGGNGGNPA